jgi:dipeptidase D
MSFRQRALILCISLAMLCSFSLLSAFYDESIGRLFSEVAYRHYRSFHEILRSADDEETLSDYLVTFAHQRYLPVIQERNHNIYIKKKFNGEHKKDDLPIIFQVSFQNKSGVAMLLALLESVYIYHPPIEAVFTTGGNFLDTGARDFGVHRLDGRHMISLDGKDANEFVVSAGGAVELSLIMPIVAEPVPNDMVAQTLIIGGFRGGHSGDDVEQGRANAIKVTAQLLHHLSRLGIGVISVDGGLDMQSIPHAVVCEILIRSDMRSEIDTAIQDFRASFVENTLDEAGVFFILEDADLPGVMLDRATMNNLLRGLMLFPNGVLTTSSTPPLAVLTSNNISLVRTEINAITINSLLRSSDYDEVESFISRINLIASGMNASLVSTQQSVGWMYRDFSLLRSMMSLSYQDIFATSPIIKRLHTPHHCAFFYRNVHDLDIVMIGGDVSDLDSFRKICHFIVKLFDRI